MSAFHNTCPDGEQSRAYEGAARPAPPLVDRTTAEWFFRTVDERAAAAASRQRYREWRAHAVELRRTARGRRRWYLEVHPSGNRPFALGEHRAMAAQAVAWAEQSGRNVYLPMVALPRRVRRQQAWQGVRCSRNFRLGRRPGWRQGLHCSRRGPASGARIRDQFLKRSRRQFQLLWLFNRLIPVEEARPLARALADVVGDADGGTADAVHVWRVPGTLNWPKEAKVARGRPLAPQPVRLLHSGGPTS